MDFLLQAAMNAIGLENPCKVGGIVLCALARTVELTNTESISGSAQSARKSNENYVYESKNNKYLSRIN